MRIAVIGAGLGGLVAAWLLETAGRTGSGHRVTLFERAAQPGFTAANLAVPDAAGRAVRVDVPLRVFYPGYYPTLTRLYADLGVASEPVSYATSFHGPAWPGRDAAALYFRYRNLRWGGQSVALPGGGGLLVAWQMAAAALRFRRLAAPALARGELAGVAIGDWAAAQVLPRSFVDGLLLPAIATVCTCTLAQAAAVPAAVAVDYMTRGLLRQSVHRALHGADDVQQRLLAGIADLRCGASIVGVRRLADHAAVELRLGDGRSEAFDHVVLATQAGASLRLLADADAHETAALAGLPDTPVQVLTHGDARLMPARRRDWSPVNLWVDTAAGAVESTIWVNAVQPALRGAPDVFQTVGPLRPVDPAMRLGEARFQRPLVTLASEQALTALQALQAQPGRRVWFCGSQAQPGVPLLESAVRSAYAVAERLGARLGALPGQVAASSA
jgi:predicted NAD/FAD-binding protein